jgi:Bacterial Ig-like domain (group 2)
MRHRTSGLLIPLVLASGCGGAKAPPPPSPVATTLQVTPARLIVAEHQARRLSSTVLDQSWTRMDVPILWQSTDDAVVTVSDSGTVTAIAPGTALIYARAQQQLAAVPVTVVEPLVVHISQSDTMAIEATDTTALDPANCYYRLSAVASGGAPGDSATWAESQIEFLDADLNQTVDTLGQAAMLDRFGTLVIRSGETWRTRPLLATPVQGTRIVNRIRYKVGDELHSEGITINCRRPADRRPPS